MPDEHRPHPMSTTQSKRRTVCDSCPNFSSLREEITGYIKRTDARLEDGGDEMSALAVEIRDLRRDTSDAQRETSSLVREVLGSVNAINMRLASGQFVANAQRAGRDIEGTTPGGKLPEIKAGPVSLKAPGWLILAALGVVAVAGSCSAAGGYVAVKVWPATKR